MRRTGDVVRALAAALALGLLVVGLPVLLVAAVGWPLPRELPTIDGIADTIAGRQPLATTTVWKVLAVILWLAWGQVMVAVVAEATAMARGALARPVPGFRFAHGLVAPLVAAIAIAWASGGTGSAAATPLPTVVAAAVPPPPAPAPPPRETIAAAPAATASTMIEHTVQRRDTLWDLAERYLGDGYRATELFELNRGRPQPDGGALTEPGVIRPGWVLRIPVPTQAPSAGSSAVVVEPGDTLWELAADELGDGHRYVEIVQLNQGRPQPDGGALTDPDLIEPGWTLALPADAPITPAQPAPTAPPPPPTPAPVDPPAPADAPVVEAPPQTRTPTTQAPRPSVTIDQPAPAVDGEHDEDEDRDDGITVPAAGLAALGIGAAGVLAALDRRRRVQHRRRTRGQHPAPVSEQAATAERLLRTSANAVDRAVLDAALRAAAAHAPAALAELDHVQLRDGVVTLVLARHLPPPPGFTGADSRWIASSQHLDELTELGAAVSAPLPALIPAGRSEEGAEIFFDAEAAGVVFVHGDADEVQAVLRSIAATVATASWTDTPEVIVVGDGLVCSLGATTMEDLVAALAVAERRARAARDAMGAAGAASVVAARVTSPTPEVFSPVVVVSTKPAGPDALELLRTVATTRVGAAVVVAADEAPGWGRSVSVRRDGASVVDGLTPTRVAVVDDTDAALVHELFEAASTPPITPDEQPVRVDSQNAGNAAPVRLADLLAEVDVLVRVLGEVSAARIVGTVEEPLVPPKQKSLEAVVYLALRDGPVDREDLQAALWPAGANSAKTFHNAVWGARRMLGADHAGADLLPEPADGRYVLSERVASDYGLFHALVETAGELVDPTAASALLEEALQLVRSEPFVGVGRGYAWVAPHAGIIVAEVVDAAEELASMRLAAGDWRAAEWAARQGLKVFGCDERLYRLLMRSSHAAGNTAGVQRVFQELLAAVADPDDGVEPEDTVHPETVALLEELTGGRSPRATA